MTVDGHFAQETIRHKEKDKYCTLTCDVNNYVYFEKHHEYCIHTLGV